MPRDGAASRAVVRLDSHVARVVGGRNAVVLAFSGGLASLVLAALVRKRCDLECVVVGMPRSADAEAAAVAQKFLDYPVRVVEPTGPAVLRAARSLRRSAPALSVAEVLSLLPSALVREDRSKNPVLTGMGLKARGAPLRSFLEGWSAQSPGLGMRLDRSSRVALRALADEVGLPESFTQAAPRRPLEGSGIGPVLREMARAQGGSLARLVSRLS